jgi:hypothetical protein
LLTALSYELLDDPNSVDLLAVKEGVETIFEGSIGVSGR